MLKLHLSVWMMEVPQTPAVQVMSETRSEHDKTEERSQREASAFKKIRPNKKQPQASTLSRLSQALVLRMEDEAQGETLLLSFVILDHLHKRLC